MDKLTRRSLPYLGAMMLLGTTTLASGPEIPKTPAGDRFRGWLESFNSGDKGKILAWHEEAMKNAPESPEELTKMVMGFREETGGFIVVQLDGTATHLNMTLRTKKEGKTVPMEMEVEGEAPYQVTKIQLRPSE